MKVFQVLAETVLALALIIDTSRLISARISQRWWLLRCMAWSWAGVAVYFPSIAQSMAALVGIDRGTDLVLYIFALGGMFVAFYFYARCEVLERQVTELIRRDAIMYATGPKT